MELIAGLVILAVPVGAFVAYNWRVWRWERSRGGSASRSDGTSDRTSH